MQNIKVIVGASYGDEGKGLATDFFGAQAKGRHETINVMTNGGPQRGHTVNCRMEQDTYSNISGPRRFRAPRPIWRTRFW
jgi:adenylosuccinate synthase